MIDPKNEKKTTQMKRFYERNIEQLCLGEKAPNLKEYGVRELYHYTTLSTLFEILENDSIWVSGLRFSNDSSEEIVLGDAWLYENSYRGDNFIFCAGEEGDRLSQWRGYCPEGGAAVGMDMARIQTYSALYADFDVSRKHKDLLGIALPVLYPPMRDARKKMTDYEGPRQIMRNIKELLESQQDKCDSLHQEDFVPYIKNEDFFEESERRLLFSNNHGELSPCIRFRRLPNGTKVPYIVVKCGCVDECHENTIQTSKKTIDGILENQKIDKELVIPDCANQAELCSAVRRYVRQEVDNSDGLQTRVFCEGHLPIRSIILAPMHNQARIEEQVVRFCYSKYWLRDVEIWSSSIPYVPSINS